MPSKTLCPVRLVAQDARISSWKQVVQISYGTPFQKVLRHNANLIFLKQLLQVNLYKQGNIRLIN